jgi:hypothetical protein
MPNSSPDPAYKYIDGKIKTINARIKKLAEAHDAVAAEQKEMATKLIAEILRTQRFLADFIVMTWAQFYRIFISQLTISNEDNVVNQLVADTTKAKAEIRTSKDPIPIAANFTSKWEDSLKKLGYPMTRI